MIRRLLCSLAAAGAGVLGASSGAASAQADGGELLRGNVRNEVEEGGDVTRVPVEGVELTVLDSTGAEVATVASDADGQFEVELPGPGDYTVRLNEDTLPDDVDLRDEEQAELVVNVRPAERQILNYFLGESQRQVEGRWDVLPQTIANGLKFGLIIAITAVGLSLIYGTTGLSNFGHGELVTLGAVVAWWMNQSVGLHILIAAPIAVLAAALAGFLVESGIWYPLRRKGVGLTSMMIFSIVSCFIYIYIFL